MKKLENDFLTSPMQNLMTETMKTAGDIVKFINKYKFTIVECASELDADPSTIWRYTQANPEKPLSKNFLGKWELYKLRGKK